MSKRFSLSYPSEKTLPSAIEVDGSVYEINPDFRVILKIYRLLGDPEIEPRHKAALACQKFYRDAFPPDAYLHLLEWLPLGGEKKRDPNAPPMDFEFDADVIYASFWQKYRIDLLAVKFLHWYAFLALLQGLGEGTPLADRLYARGRDTKGLKGKDKQSAEIAKHNAQIPKRMSSTEEALQSRIADALMHGGDINAILRGE